MEVKVNEEITCKRKKLSFFSQQIYFSRGGKHRVVTILMKKNRIFRLENQMVRAIPFGKLQKYGL